MVCLLYATTKKKDFKNIVTTLSFTIEKRRANIKTGLVNLTMSLFAFSLFFVPEWIMRLNQKWSKHIRNVPRASIVPLSILEVQNTNLYFCCTFVTVLNSYWLKGQCHTFFEKKKKCHGFDFNFAHLCLFLMTCVF